VIRLYRSFLAPYRLFIAGTVLLIFVQTLCNLSLPSLMASIVDNGIVKNDTGYIENTGKQMLALAGLGVICALIAALISSRVAAALGRDVRGRLFARVEQFSLHEIDRFGAATLITRTTNDVTQVQMVTLMLLRIMIMAPLMAIGGIILAVRQDRPLTLVLAVSVPVLVLTIVAIARTATPLFGLMQIKLDRLNLVMREGLTGIRVIRAFDRTTYQTERFDDANLDLTDNAIRVNRIIAILFPTLMIIMNFTSLAIIWFGAHLIGSGEMQVGALLAFIQYGMQIMFSFLLFSMLFVMVPRAAAAAKRINEVLEVQPDIVDPERPVTPGAEHGVVEFRDVTFCYAGAEQPALENVSFRAGPGQVTAIIGSTGAGKSTLIHLIPRFYDVDGGAVLVDGVDVREMTQRDLRARIGFAPQRTVLFSGSVADNLRFGREDAAADELEHAADVASAEFIAGMDGGMDAAVAQGGSNLSGGQKQRLSIGRVVVRRPEIYLFDDSFSALDFRTDARVRAALRRETGEATVIIVAQRVATVMDADQIIVLDEGRIAGIGTHRQLLGSSEVYREIVASQLSAEEVA
jgi:ATP-binding cassette, subfamily B, multidrug efflux pump